ncbi:TetR/AcrR family transcriptional regulator [Azospirillum picis]|uniref:AcrR family transcriptional regulator n=1 Tax=Azospirillum picis TaxID=488438 RepID=A0ABU0MQJ7_9PROT|nr:TetR/AcrR family transcriptional regulator [Azospirillum picis]MBP2302171.1 AcrR family transcriptional regulator [Azospirillum picis]MDQ0535750.1 AcrR family transcriptional regulator [Azospirillum picis]
MATKHEIRQARVQAILEAGEQVLLHKGMAGFGLRPVAAAAGLGLSHVQYYFRTPSDLLQALVEHYLTGWDERLSQCSDDLDMVVDAIVAGITDTPSCSLIAELWAVAGRDRVANAALGTFYDGYVARLAVVMGKADPRLSPSQAHTRARLVTAMLEGLWVLGRSGGASALPSRDHILLAVHAVAAAPIG